MNPAIYANISVCGVNRARDSMNKHNNKPNGRKKKKNVEFKKKKKIKKLIFFCVNKTKQKMGKQTIYASRMW